MSKAKIFLGIAAIGTLVIWVSREPVDEEAEAACRAEWNNQYAQRAVESAQQENQACLEKWRLGENVECLFDFDPRVYYEFALNLAEDAAPLTQRYCD